MLVYYSSLTLVAIDFNHVFPVTFLYQMVPYRCDISHPPRGMMVPIDYSSTVFDKRARIMETRVHTTWVCLKMGCTSKYLQMVTLKWMKNGDRLINTITFGLVITLFSYKPVLRNMVFIQFFCILLDMGPDFATCPGFALSCLRYLKMTFGYLWHFYDVGNLPSRNLT